MRKNSKSIITNIILSIIGFIVFAWLLPQKPVSPLQNTAVSESSTTDKIEIPAKIANRQEQIITHIGYAVSYNADWKIPNWVAYELTKEEVAGTVSRLDDFLPDPNVPYEKSAIIYDYQNSGWDRSHMAPTGDMKWSEQAVKESFYFSNICPQNKNLNGGIWHDLEIQIRNVVIKKGNIYVVCGPIVSKQPKTIGSNNVAIPDGFFKVLLQNNDGKYSAIAFIFANESGRKPLSTYAMSVEDMQIITDIDFFPALPDSIEKEVESQMDFTQWNIKSKK
jgi:endonuclease G